MLPRGSSALGALLRILPADDVGTADTLVTAGAIAMFVAAMLCVVAIPSALNAARVGARRDRAPRPAPSAATDDRASRSTRCAGIGPSKLVPTQVIHVGSHGAASRWS